MADSHPAAPGVIVQTDVDPAPESYAINTGKLFLFDVVLTPDSGRTLVLGRPISFMRPLDQPSRRVLYVSDSVTNQPVTLYLDQLYTVFPATAEGEYFTQACRQMLPISALHTAFLEYEASTPGAQKLPALQFAKLNDLEAALSKVSWVKEQIPTDVTPEQHAVVAACVDTMFRIAAQHAGPDDHRLRMILRDTALEVMRLAPTVQQRWLDAEKAGSTIRTLRRQLTDAQNKLLTLGAAQALRQETPSHD